MVLKKAQLIKNVRLCQLNIWDKVEANKVVICDQGHLAFKVTCKDCCVFH